MSFIEQNSSTLVLTEIFNEEHASILFEQQLSSNPNINTLVLNNVGIKIMKDAFEKFTELPIEHVELNYNWNLIMMMPKLVCYDKNTWKTLQQLANWNREWSNAFKPCFGLKSLRANIVCSWADEEFVKSFLGGLQSLPNLGHVEIKISSKNKNLEEILKAYQNANIFNSFQYQFEDFKQ